MQYGLHDSLTVRSAYILAYSSIHPVIAGREEGEVFQKLFGLKNAGTSEPIANDLHKQTEIIQ